MGVFYDTKFIRFQSTPLMRGETCPTYKCPRFMEISIHSPHARGDEWSNRSNYKCNLFQSTPLMRGETASATSRRNQPGYFNPLPSCEGRRMLGNAWLNGLLFQSTPLMRGETVRVRNYLTGKIISIHSPHARGDDDNSYISRISVEISIHSPHARGDTG